MKITKEFLEKVRGLQTEDWEQVDQLLKTLRYIIGIAERGEGRKCEDSESPEQFVLGYVKKLEAAAAPTPPAQEPLTDTYIQTVPDKCDRIVWRNIYYHLPLQSAPEVEPIPMVLHCPSCMVQHIDQPQPERGWANPPHRSHECQSCGHVWRPADVATVGVAAIQTKGKDDSEPAPEVDPVAFQGRVQPWMMACFGKEISSDTIERNHRFLEEALELVQSCGCTQDEARQLVDYVYGRPIGLIHQEVGGVMVTLAALCLAHGLDMHQSGEVELARIWTKVEQIRAKQAAKPRHSPLPVSPPAPEVESVAWVNSSDLISAKIDRARYGDGGPELYTWKAGQSDYHNTPLYTQPANDGLRKAVEHLLECLELGFARSNAEEALRAELNKDKS